uniref:PH domain-containing protein n=1 Tax=Meloidogyne hapla TaxID=6305 RepID=A0A1I8BTN5_MELHA
MQRLVKYPLLLETIAKYTREGSEELQQLLHGIERAKRILSVVNSDKRNAENEKRMEELQQRLDFTGCEKSFFQRFDFRAHKLIYDGHLQWRQARGKTLDLHVVLLEHLLVFLTKLGSDSGNASTPQKLQLKIHEAGCIPIMRLSAVEVEEKPGDKRSFNLLYKSDLRVFELVAQTATERKTWFRLIENQVSVTRSSPAPTDFDNILDGILTSGAQQQQNRGTPPPLLAQRANIVDSGLHQVAKVEHVHVLTHPTLVNANEIVIQQPKIMENAQPIIPAAERLRKNDKIIISALAEKHQILAEMLLEDGDKSTVNPKELERITELMTGLSVAELKQRNSKELAMSAIVHGNRLLDCINQGMNNVNKEESKKDSEAETERNLPSVPCYRLTSVAAPLMNHLKETEQNNSRKTASEETLVKSDGCGGQSPVSSRSVVAPRSTPHLTALRATPSNCSSSSSPNSPQTVPFE